MTNETVEKQPASAHVLEATPAPGETGQAGVDETAAPVTREATDRVWRLFRRKLARKHPDHPWVLPAEAEADADAGPGEG